MGCSAIASCPCGYESPPLMIGCGMSSDRDCLFPAYCIDGGHLITVNLFDIPLQCPDGHRAEPILYDTDTLTKERGKNVVVEWEHDGRPLRLTDGRYLCPACHNGTLTFSDGSILWD